MQPDLKAIETAGEVRCTRVHTALCQDQIDRAAALMGKDDVMIACGQEARVFADLAEDMGLPAPRFVDLRDRAGWSDDAPQAGPKMAALVAEALLPPLQVRQLDLASQGQCLIMGPPDVALAAANDLAGELAVTVLLDPAEAAEADLPNGHEFEVIAGRLTRASGGFGAYEVTIDALQMLAAGGRGARRFTPPRDGGKSRCDLILDLRGTTPLFAHGRDGYLRADPRYPPAVARATIQAAGLVGSFEKPLFTVTEPALCAHSRAQITGCSRCIDACATGAITPDGDHVRVDPLVCMGCGGCHAVCPSGAIGFGAPDFAAITRRLDTLARAYRGAGGTAPRLLVHDRDFGPEMISLAARFGRGLPADVIPFEVPSLTIFGHAEMLAALAAGFAGVELLLAPASERDLIEAQADLARTISGKRAAITLIDVADPDALSDTLYAKHAPDPLARPIAAMGSRRQVTRMAARALRGLPDTAPPAPIALPMGAPYGAVEVDTDACTLCLSCVSLCPSGALMDNPDSPELKFQEDACLQCGICARACPESAMTLVPRLDLSDAALGQRILHREDPFACISCGTPFGVKSSIDHILNALAGKHPAFASSAQAQLIQMCDTCRIEAQFHSETNPFQSAPAPRPRMAGDAEDTAPGNGTKRRDH